MKHVMIDIETFGVQPYSAIIGIGAALFEPQGHTMTDTFHVTIDPEAAQKAGFRIDAATVTWWLHPDQRPAWDKFRNTIHFEPHDAFNGFGQWLDTVGPREDICVWGNGAGFDCNLMHNAAQLLNIGHTTKDGEAREGLWPHWNDRCFRTLKNMLQKTYANNDDRVTAKSLVPPMTGTVHVAVDDAVQQALWMQNICRNFHLDF